MSVIGRISIWCLVIAAVVGLACGSSVCSLPKDPGFCNGFFTRYYYNSARGRCETFIYRGCLGNANNFRSLLQCQNSCVSVGPPECSLPKDRGPCKAYFRRYYFNKTKGECQLFIYGGCFGNANRFNTRLQCQNRCGGR